MSPSVCKPDSVATSICNKLFDKSKCLWIPDMNDLCPFMFGHLKVAYEIVSFRVCW